MLTVMRRMMLAMLLKMCMSKRLRNLIGGSPYGCYVPEEYGRGG